PPQTTPTTTLCRSEHASVARKARRFDSPRLKRPDPTRSTFHPSGRNTGDVRGLLGGGQILATSQERPLQRRFLAPIAPAAHDDSSSGSTPTSTSSSDSTPHSTAPHSARHSARS